MGIVNVTPDSFSDGGRFLAPDRAIAHARELAAGGADLLDIGGESTRPGAREVSAEEELARVAPVLEGIRGVDAAISIDTSKAAVAVASLDAGAEIVNDVTALRHDPVLAGLCAERECTVVLMHMQGTPRTMQENPTYDDVVDDVKAFLAERIEFAVGRGSPRSASGSTRGSGSARLSTTTSSCSAGSPRCGSWGGPSSWDRRESASSASSRGARWTIASAARSPATSSRCGRVPTSSGSTTWPRRDRRCWWPGPSSTRPRPRRTGRWYRPRTLEADRSPSPSVDVEIRGLSIFTHHGGTEAAREIGTRLEIDVSFDVPDCDAVLTDRLEDTVDYAEVCDIVALGATERSYKTLERLCQVIAERLMERFACESVRVRAAKPEPPLPIAVEQVGVEVLHLREDTEVGEDDDGE